MTLSHRLTPFARRLGLALEVVLWLLISALVAYACTGRRLAPAATAPTMPMTLQGGRFAGITGDTAWYLFPAEGYVPVPVQRSAR